MCSDYWEKEEIYYAYILRLCCAKVSLICAKDIYLCDCGSK